MTPEMYGKWGQFILNLNQYIIKMNITWMAWLQNKINVTELNSKLITKYPVHSKCMAFYL